MMNSEEYTYLFLRVGMKEFVNEEMHEEIKRFVYIYCKKSAGCLNELRHQIYCPRGGKISFELLHPCLNVWRLNANRANHQAKVWRSNLDPHFAPPFPIGHGWQLDDQGNIDIDWMKCNPTSEEVRVLFQIS